RVTITHNTIQQNTVVTNGYGIYVAGEQNFEVAYNTVTPTNGRGIIMDGYSQIPVMNGDIHDNYVSVQETYNREYPGAGLEATAFRLRNFGYPQRDLHIWNNTFIATTGPGLANMAYGARVNYYNPTGAMDNSGIVLENNLIKGIVTTTDTAYDAAALG